MLTVQHFQVRTVLSLQRRLSKKAQGQNKVAIFEIKSASVGSDIVTISEKALAQIEDKNYAEALMSNKTVNSVYSYGITFAGKSCAISVKKLK